MIKRWPGLRLSASQIPSSSNSYPLPRPGASRSLARQDRCCGQGSRAGLKKREQARRPFWARQRQAFFVVQAGALEAAGESSSGVCSISGTMKWAAGSVPGWAIPTQRRDGWTECLWVGAEGWGPCRARDSDRTGPQPEKPPPSLLAFHCPSMSEVKRLLCARSETPSTKPPPHPSSLQFHEHT